MTAPPKIRRVDYYPDEFLAGVVDLKLEEIAAYWIVCTLIYSRGGPIDDDDARIAHSCRCHWRTWRTIKERLIELGKLRVEAGKITNGRAMIELAKVRRRIDDATKASHVAAKQRSQRNPDTPKNASGSVQDGVTIESQSPQDQNDGADINDLASSGGTSNQQPSTSNQQPAKRERRAAGAATRATRLPKGWRPTEELRTWARAEGFEDQRVDQQTKKFIDHFVGNGKAMVDWPATWRNWIRNAHDPNHFSNQGRGSSQPAERKSYVDMARDSLDRLIANGSPNEEPRRPGINLGRRIPARPNKPPEDEAREVEAEVVNLKTKRPDW